MNWEDTVSDFQSVVASGKRWCHVVLLLDDAVEFPKRGQGSRPHPHDEVFINEAVVLRVGVQLKDRLTPVDWFSSCWKREEENVKCCRGCDYIFHFWQGKNKEKTSYSWTQGGHINPEFSKWPQMYYKYLSKLNKHTQVFSCWITNTDYTGISTFQSTL